MKRMVAVIALCALAGTMAYGQVTQVVSRNAVGYVKVGVQSNAFVLSTFQFEDIDGADVHSEDLFGDQLPLGTVISAFNPVTQTYEGGVDSKGFLGWDTNIVYQRGMAFWIQTPGGAGAPTNELYEVFLMGEVPDGFTAPDTDVDVVSGFSMVSYGYPASILWTNTGIASNAISGDVLNYWDPTAGIDGKGAYVPNSLGFLGWDDPNLVLEPGMGFFYQTASAQQWSETKPYTWP